MTAGKSNRRIHNDFRSISAIFLAEDPGGIHHSGHRGGASPPRPSPCAVLGSTRKLRPIQRTLIRYRPMCCGFSIVVSRLADSTLVITGGFFRSRHSPWGTLAYRPWYVALPCFLAKPSVAALRNRRHLPPERSLTQGRPYDYRPLSFAFAWNPMPSSKNHLRAAGFQFKEMLRLNCRPASRTGGGDRLAVYRIVNISGREHPLYACARPFTKRYVTVF